MSKRFTSQTSFDGLSHRMVEFEHGEYVRYADYFKLEKAIAELLDAMETCHFCKGKIVVEDGPTRCEDCPYGCESHDAPDCVPISELHQSTRDLLSTKSDSVPVLCPDKETA